MAVEPVGGPSANSYIVSFELGGEIFQTQLIVGANGQQSMDDAIQVFVDHMASWSEITNLQATRSDSQLNLITPAPQP